jgi:hypothetical protein
VLGVGEERESREQRTEIRDQRSENRAEGRGQRRESREQREEAHLDLLLRLIQKGEDAIGRR